MNSKTQTRIGAGSSKSSTSWDSATRKPQRRWACRFARCSASGSMREFGCSRGRRLRVHSERQDDEVVMSLLEQALNKPVEDRELYLRKECSDNPELLREVWEYVQ